MQEDTPKTFRYAYCAQTPRGQTIDGEIIAESVEAARESLADINLRITEIKQVEDQPASPLRGGEFAAFNQQLAQLTKAGLPVESGLRLIAREMRNGRLAESVNRVAQELENGLSLPDAFEKHRKLFPDLYGRLIDAGVRSNNLPAVLFSLGRHMDLMQRLRAAVWRAVSYPLVIMIGIVIVLGFLGVVIVPGFEEIYLDFSVELPLITQAVFVLAKWILPIVAGLGVLVLLIFVMWSLLRSLGKAQAFVDYLMLPIPMIGLVLQRNLIARWCDALKLGIQAGLDLSDSLTLAGDVVGSPLLKRDGQTLIDTLESGQPIEKHGRLTLAPESVPAAIHLASHRHDLPSLLDNLADIYQQQAELRTTMLQAVLTPILLVAVAMIIGVIVSALFMPLAAMMTAVM